MELEDRVRRAADDLRGKERVTYTAVRERLKRDGKACSYSDRTRPVMAALDGIAHSAEA